MWLFYRFGGLGTVVGAEGVVGPAGGWASVDEVLPVVDAAAGEGFDSGVVCAGAGLGTGEGAVSNRAWSSVGFFSSSGGGGTSYSSV